MNQVLEIKDYTDFLNDTSKYMLRSYTYDDLGRPTAIEYRDNMSSSSSDIKEGHYYTYDKNYNIIEERIVNKYGQANGAGIYDDTTGLYYLNARYYDPADAIFLTQDTYRGGRSRTYILNYYAYCAGNPISYTDPSGHAIWGVVGAAMGAYDGYKYAKKKKLKGVKKAAAIVGGVALGAINPFKVVKAASKAGKLVKNGVKAAKALKNGKKVSKAAKATKATKYKVVKPDKKLANNRYNKATSKAVNKASNVTNNTSK